MPELINQQNVLGDLAGLERIERFAELMAGSKVSIPAELQNNPGDCLAVCLQAAAWQMNPFSVAQKTHVIKGKIGYEAQLINAVITRWAPIEGRLQFAYSEGWERILGKTHTKQGKTGDYLAPAWSAKDEEGLWCEVSATLHNEQQPRILRVMMSQAWPRQSANWASDPKQQLAYTAVKRWARLHCPDVILGIYTPDELDRPKQPPKAVDDILQERAGAIIDDERAAMAETGFDFDNDDNNREMADMALDAFKNCKTEDDLQQVGKDLKHLIPEQHREELQAAFLERLQDLKNRGQAIDVNRQAWPQGMPMTNQPIMLTVNGQHIEIPATGDGNRFYRWLAWLAPEQRSAAYQRMEAGVDPGDVYKTAIEQIASK